MTETDALELARSLQGRGADCMPVFTFYCCRPDGVAPSFDAADLPSAAHAEAHAAALIQRHPACSHVEVRLGEDVVLTHARETAGAA